MIIIQSQIVIFTITSWQQVLQVVLRLMSEIQAGVLQITAYIRQQQEPLQQQALLTEQCGLHQIQQP